MHTIATSHADIWQQHAQLLEARQSYEPAWRDLADHFLPTRYKDSNASIEHWRKMPMLNNTLVDATGILAIRTLAAGLQGGLTSPARPWFQLSLEDADLAGNPAVKEWLHALTKRMRKIFHASNFYNAVHTMYGELGTFGTAFMLQLADMEHGFRFLPFSAGEYCLDTNARQEVDVVFRRFSMTARQLIQHFGIERMPAYLQQSTSMHHVAHSVVHAIYPRKNASQNGRGGAISMPFASVYWLEGHMPHTQSAAKFSRTPYNSKGSAGGIHILSESGFEEFPGYGVRWYVAGNEVYGHSPAMDVLPDCRMLQQMGITTLKAIHKSVDPPTAVSASLKNIGLDLTPGGVNYVEAAPGQSPQAATPILQVRPEIQAARNAMQDVQKQIQQGLYNDLFRMLLDSQQKNVTAKEVAVREEEKLILLGPVLERLHNELFTPLITRTFKLMLRHDMLPKAPPMLAETDIKVEFVSLLAQAQKLVCTNAVNQLVHFVNSLEPIDAQASDCLDADKAVEEYADYLGVAPAILRTKTERELLREERIAKQHALAAAETDAKKRESALAEEEQHIQNIQGMANTIHTLSKSSLSTEQSPNALGVATHLLQQLGSKIPQPEEGL